MMDKKTALKAIEAGVKRQHCKLIDCTFEGDNVVIVVKGTAALQQIGREYNWSQKEPNQLALRVSRFCSHYANNINFKFQWGESLV